MTTWKPIETAPKDEEVMLCEYRYKVFSHIDVGSWGVIDEDDLTICGWLTNNGCIEEPTHWMHVPEFA